MQNTAQIKESQLQSECFKWVWNQYPQTRGCIFHVPNGEKRNVLTANKLKAMGVVRGIPDLLFLWHNKLHAIEMKTDDGKLSKYQKAIHAEWKQHEIVELYTINSLHDFQDLIISIIKSTKNGSN